jgi:hypothetical protein
MRRGCGYVIASMKVKTLDKWAGVFGWEHSNTCVVTFGRINDELFVEMDTNNSDLISFDKNYHLHYPTLPVY